MTYHDELERIVTATAEQVAAAVTLHDAGRLTGDVLAAVVVAFLQAGNTAAAALADLSCAAVLTARSGVPVAPLGVAPAHAIDETRLAKATATLLDVPGASLPRWQRLARGEGQEAAARAYSAAVARHPQVTGWTRGLSAHACQLCRWWYRDGRVWPDDHPMPTHTGCTCHPIPTMEGTR